MNHILVVCDEEQDYAAKLVDYLNLKESFPFDVRCFSESGKLLEFEKHQTVELILCSENVAIELEELSHVKKILLQEKRNEYFSEWDKIWKYQSCEEIIHQLMVILSQSDLEFNHLARKKKLRTIGFYSPVKRCLQTTMALSLGELIGKRAKTLYINLESCCVLSEILNLSFPKDLSDVIYDMQTSLKGDEFYLASVTKKYHDLYLLPSMSNQNDLITVPGKIWLELLKKIENETDYEYLVLDLSDGVQGLYEILRQCNLVYELSTENKVSKSKVGQYHLYLEKSGYDDVIKNIKACQIPFYRDFPESFEKLRTTEFGKYVKSLVKDEFYARG